VSALVSKKDFAAILGCSKAYVSQLVAARRLVLSDDGRQVDVERSLEQLGAHADPSKAGVRERWAAYRAERAGAAGAGAQAGAAVAAVPVRPAPAAPAAAASAQDGQPSLLDDQAPPAQPPAAPSSTARSEYQDARTLREQAEAEMAQIELMRVRGRVLDAEPTLRAIADAQVAVRGELLGLADRLAPLVAAETDRRKVWELINAECERLCGRVQQAAQRMAEKAKAEVSA